MKELYLLRKKDFDMKNTLSQSPISLLLGLSILSGGCSSGTAQEVSAKIYPSEAVVQKHIDRPNATEELFSQFRIHAQALEALGHQTDFKRQEVLDKQLEAIISPKIDLDTAVQGFTSLASENTFNTETQFSYILDQIMDTATAYVEKEPNSTLGKNFTEVLTNYEKNMYIHLGNTPIGTLPASYIQGQYGETLGSGVQIKLKAVYDLLQACIEEDSSKTKPLGYHLKRTLVTFEETKKYYTNLGRALDIYAYGKDSSLSSAQETLIHINGLAAHEEALVEKAQTKIKHRFYPEMSIPTLPRRAQTTR